MIRFRCPSLDGPVRAAVTGIAAALLVCLPAEPRAELLLNAEVRVTAENNIVGLLSGNNGASAGGGTGGGPMAAAGGKGFGGASGSGTGSNAGNYTGAGNRSPGDLSVAAAVEAGGITEPDSRLSLFARGFAERTDYQSYSEYDSTVAGVTAGMTAWPRGTLSLRIAGYDRIKRYDNDPDRDGTEYGGSASLKQLIAGKFWLRESAEYQTYRASYQDFSFRGTTWRFISGYNLTPALLVTAGYRFQAQQYRDASATVLRTGTPSIGADYLLSPHWSTALLYERQTSEAGTSDVITRNDMVSLSLRWDY